MNTMDDKEKKLISLINTELIKTDKYIIHGNAIALTSDIHKLAEAIILNFPDVLNDQMTKWPEKKTGKEVNEFGQPINNIYVEGFNEAFTLCRAAHEEEVRELREVCASILEYLDGRMDCDDGVPNEEMNLHTELKQALSRLTKEEG